MQINTRRDMEKHRIWLFRMPFGSKSHFMNSSHFVNSGHGILCIGFWGEFLTTSN